MPFTEFPHRDHIHLQFCRNDFRRFSCPLQVAGIDYVELFSGKTHCRGFRLNQTGFIQSAVEMPLEAPLNVFRCLPVSDECEICCCHDSSIFCPVFCSFAIAV